MNNKHYKTRKKRTGLTPAKEPQCVVNYALYCLKSETNEATLRKKLKNKTDNLDWIDEAIVKVKDWGYLNDARYAGMYVRNAIKMKGWGERRIKQEMRMKGLADEVIEQALAENDDSEPESMALNALSKKFKTPIIEMKERARAQRYLVTRGFSFGDISNAIKAHNESLENED